MEGDDTPLLVVTPGDETESEKDLDTSKDILKDMVLFHGKELAGKSFIRSPHYNLVRIGISKEGVFKVDTDTPKILTQWKFREIRDSSYSGYSCTLQFKGGKSDYSVRTDDGEAICSYIEAFHKNPDKATERAKRNPPVSKVPESGLMTLRRKFSGDKHPPEVKFYTLNRRPKKNTHDPASNLVHNIEVDSRLRNKHSAPLNGHDLENRRSYSFEPHTLSPDRSNHTPQYHSTSDVRTSSKMNGGVTKRFPEKQLARNMLSQHIKRAEENEKRMSKEINVSPVTTRGEVTHTQSTKASSATPTSATSTKRWSSNSPHLERKALPSHIIEFSKAGSAPPCLPPDGEGKAMSSSSMSKAHGMKQLNRLKSPPLVGVASKKDRPPPDRNSPSSDDNVPLIRKGDSSESSGDLYSPSDDFTFLAPTDASKRPVSGSSGSSSGSNQNYDHLEFANKRQDSWESFSTSASCSPAPPLQPAPPPGSTSPSKLSKSSSAESGVYDHLPVVISPPPKDTLAPVDTGLSMQRNISMPMLTKPSSPVDQDRNSNCENIDEESSDELGVTPTNSDEEGKPVNPEGAGEAYKGVVLRKKKQRPELEDPFADLLLSPKASSRLRWSQELNPLYEYIKGFKADGVKLYDSAPTSKLLQSTTAASLEGGGTPGKPPSVILEVEGEGGEGEEGRACSADTQSIGSQDEWSQSEWSQDTLSEWSQDTQSIGSQDTQSVGSQDMPTSPCFPMGVVTLGLPPKNRKLHNYEDVQPLRTRIPSHDYEDINYLAAPPSPSSSAPSTPSPLSIMNQIKRTESDSTTQGQAHAHGRSATQRLKQKQGLKSSTTIGKSPRLGKREIQRRSRTLMVRDDSETAKPKQRPVRVADALKDFSFVMREFRMFFIKLPNGYLAREIFSINKPISELRERLCDYLGIESAEQYELVIEGACLSSLRESDASGEVARVNRVGPNYLLDSHALPDQGQDPTPLKSALSFKMQGVSTSTILALRPIVPEETLNVSLASDPPTEEDEFHKCWISVVQGNHPLPLDKAVKLAALQYQAYFLDRTAVNSVVGFSRPTEFLPVEYMNVRGVEQKMYKEQEALVKKSHRQIEDDYIDICADLESYGAIFFPAREPRKKLLQSTKLKPVIFGVGPRGILRVDPKTKELLGFWHYSVLKNWAYSKRTFVLAFRDKSFPVESNQAKWISLLVDFFVDSLVLLRSTAESKVQV